jgi:hypothetical protein
MYKNLCILINNGDINLILFGTDYQQHSALEKPLYSKGVQIGPDPSDVSLLHYLCLIQTLLTDTTHKQYLN